MCQVLQTFVCSGLFGVFVSRVCQLHRLHCYHACVNGLLEQGTQAEHWYLTPHPRTSAGILAALIMAKV